MSQADRSERVRQIHEALETDPDPLVTVSSVYSARNSSGPGLATLPYLTINDIAVLREAGFEELEDLEARLLEVPDPVWDHVLRLVRTGVVQPDEEALGADGTRDEGSS